jgi:hypothetical protein
MGKNKVKVIEIQPGMLLYQPEHKSGVLAAIKGYNERHKKQTGRTRAAQGTLKLPEGKVIAPKAVSSILHGQTLKPV